MKQPQKKTIDDAVANELMGWISKRRSIAALDIPAPSAEQVSRAIACAMTAPDHKKLQPWRFYVVEKNARHAFGRALQAAAVAQGETNTTTLAKYLQQPLRAPMIIVCVTKRQPHEKVPQFEQLLSTGAAVQNMLLAFQAMGFNSVWRTGLLANEPAIKQCFNARTEDYIAGFVYVGTSYCMLPSREPIDTSNILTFWQPKDA